MNFRDVPIAMGNALLVAFACSACGSADSSSEDSNASNATAVSSSALYCEAPGGQTSVGILFTPKASTVQLELVDYQDTEFTKPFGGQPLEQNITAHGPSDVLAKGGTLTASGKDFDADGNYAMTLDLSRPAQGAKPEGGSITITGSDFPLRIAAAAPFTCTVAGAAAAVRCKDEAMKAAIDMEKKNRSPGSLPIKDDGGSHIAKVKSNGDGFEVVYHAHILDERDHITWAVRMAVGGAGCTTLQAAVIDNSD
jgi:hypothetical protein